MDINLNTEEKLILLICKVFLRTEKPQKLQFYIEENDIDWSSANKKWHEHKLLQITFFTFKRINLGTKYPTLMNSMNKNVKKKFNRSKTLFDEQKKVYEIFQKVGVDIFPYKGVILSHKYYPNPILRDSVDIDFAISEEHLEKSIPIMQDLDYHLHKENRDVSDITKMRSYDIDFSWVSYDEKGDLKFNTEFHWQPSHSVLWVPLTFKDIMGEVEEYKINDTSIKSFKSNLHIILVLIHHGLVDGWGKVRHLIDFALVLKNTSKADFDEVVILCKKYKIYNTLLVGIEINHLLFNFPKPNIAIPKNINKLAQKMATQVMKGELSGKWSEQKVKLRYYLNMRDSLMDKIKSILVLGRFIIAEKRNKLLS